MAAVPEEQPTVSVEEADAFFDRMFPLAVTTDKKNHQLLRRLRDFRSHNLRSVKLFWDERQAGSDVIDVLVLEEDSPDFKSFTEEAQRYYRILTSKAKEGEVIARCRSGMRDQRFGIEPWNVRRRAAKEGKSYFLVAWCRGDKANDAVDGLISKHADWINPTATIAAPYPDTEIECIKAAAG